MSLEVYKDFTLCNKKNFYFKHVKKMFYLINKSITKQNNLDVYIFEKEQEEASNHKDKRIILFEQWRGEFFCIFLKYFCIFLLSFIILNSSCCLFYCMFNLYLSCCKNIYEYKREFENGL